MTRARKIRAAVMRLLWDALDRGDAAAVVQLRVLATTADRGFASEAAS